MVTWCFITVDRAFSDWQNSYEKSWQRVEVDSPAAE